MPEIGEIKRGCEVGILSSNCAHRQYQWNACKQCGKERWVTLVNKHPHHLHCRNCVGTSLNSHLEGQRFGRLTVLNYVYTTGARGRWLCKCDCGKMLEVITNSLTSGHTKSCGCLNAELRMKRSGKSSRCWKGGRNIKQGYVYVANPFYPKMSHTKYRYEHDVIMETYLGRRLLPQETVHHKNGIKNDNRREENLELWSSSHPPGQKVQDKIEWCTLFLNTYAPKRLRKQFTSKGLPLL